MFNFDKDVQIRCWVSGCLIETVSAEQGLMMMLLSTRFDNDHATANGRCLHPRNAANVGIPDNFPVIFTQG